MTTTYQYLDGILARTVTLDTASNTVSSHAYTYANGELVGIERHPQTGYFRTSITYFTPDSIAIEESNAANFPPGSRQILMLRNGNTKRQYIYEDTQSSTSWAASSEPTLPGHPTPHKALMRAGSPDRRGSYHGFQGLGLPSTGHPTPRQALLRICGLMGGGPDGGFGAIAERP